MKEKLFFAPLSVAASILSVGLVVASSVGAYAAYSIKTFDNGLTVTGSAKTTVEADSAKWTLNLTRSATEDSLQDGYDRMAQDLKKTRAFLSAKGFTNEQITVVPVSVQEVYHSDQYMGPKEYNLVQTVTVQSSDVAKVGQVAGEVQGLVVQGVFAQANAPEYFYTKLADLRVSLLADAIKDAKARAEQIAKSNGNSVGTLKAASSGVVQVLAPNSVEIQDAGQYDTSTVSKDVMATVRATFVIK
jgi:hypothetical protein